MHQRRCKENGKKKEEKSKEKKQEKKKEDKTNNSAADRPLKPPSELLSENPGEEAVNAGEELKDLARAAAATPPTTLTLLAAAPLSHPTSKPALASTPQPPALPTTLDDLIHVASLAHDGERLAAAKVGRRMRECYGTPQEPKLPLAVRHFLASRLLELGPEVQEELAASWRTLPVYHQQRLLSIAASATEDGRVSALAHPDAYGVIEVMAQASLKKEVKMVRREQRSGVVSFADASRMDRVQDLASFFFPSHLPKEVEHFRPEKRHSRRSSSRMAARREGTPGKTRVFQVWRERTLLKGLPSGPQPQV